MFRQMTIGAKMMAGFIIVALISVLIGLAGFLISGNLAKNAGEAAILIPQMNGIGKMSLSVAESSTMVMEIIAAESAGKAEASYSQHRKSASDFEKYATALERGGTVEETQLTAVDASAKKALEEASAIHENELLPAVQKLYEAKKSALAGGSAGFTQLESNIDSITSRLNDTLDSLESDFSSIADKTKSTSDREAKASRILMIAGMLLSGIISTLLGIMISRSITRPVNRIIGGLSEGAEQTTSASSQVSTASQHLAEGASEQASSLEEISSSIEEMASMTKKNADNAMQANSLAKKARSAADKGGEAIIKMTSAMDKINDSSNQTSKIIKTIDEIAFQTNLLALNAAVEAARAGDAGKGFAVVAEEVRNLARRSAEAARNTAMLIEESMNNAQNGSLITDDLSKSFTDIIEGSAKVSDLVAEIAAASDEQSQGIEQINIAVSQMDKVTQQNASSAEESAAAAEELSSQAAGLMDMVDSLISIVGSNAEHHAYSAAGGNGFGSFEDDFVRNKTVGRSIAPRSGGNGKSLKKEIELLPAGGNGRGGNGSPHPVVVSELDEF